MDNSKKKKKEQLGMSPGTATHRLRKSIMFVLVKETNRDTCFRCGEKILNIEEFSIEHKIPWLDSENPKKLFYEFDNIAFSHLSCNVGAARQTNKKYSSIKEKRIARRPWNAAYMRNHYTTEKRREKKRLTGW